VNTVQDLRQALSEEVKRLQPPAGLEARVLQQALRSSAAVAAAHRADRRGAFRSSDSKSIEAPRLIALVAALLAVAIVISLVLAARALHLISVAPASHGPVGQGIVLNHVDYHCSLPVAIALYPEATVRVQLPGGIVVDKSIQPVDRYRQSSFDAQARQWVPVPRQAVSPDGRSWAYGTGMLEGGGRNGTVHVVDVVGAKDRQLWAGAGGAMVLGFLSSGVYFVEIGATATETLWVVDPASPSSAHTVGSLPNWDIGPGVDLFGMSGAFALVRSGSNRYPDRVERMDLATGTITTWFKSAVGPTQIELLGLDGQGLPIIAMDPAKPEFAGDGSIVYRGVQDQPSRILDLTGPDQFVQISDGSNVAFRPTSAIADKRYGVWFSEPGSIWQYELEPGLREVFAMPPTLFPEPTPKMIPGLPSPSPPVATPPSGGPSGVGLTVIGPCI
jgi:hypothetical protein